MAATEAKRNMQEVIKQASAAQILLHEDAVVNDAGQIVKGGCIVVGEAGKILMVEYQHESFYGFPKGHTDRGETVEQTAYRETLEETGYEVETMKRLPDFIYSSGFHKWPVCVSFFLAKAGQGGGEAEESWHWVPLDGVGDKLRPDAELYWRKIRPEVEAIMS